MQVSVKIALYLLLFVASKNVFAENHCVPIASQAADRLAAFVHDKFQFAPETIIELANSDVINDACYRKLHFRIEGSGPGEVVFFLSPDQKFLSRDLLDSTVDLAAEKKAILEKQRSEQRQMQEQLSNGAFPTRGPDTAPITLTMFSDFQCPFCRQQAEILEQFDNTELRVVFRHLPLPMHPWARTAAEMAACVYRQSNDAFWFMHDSLFREQQNLTSANLNEYVQATLAKRTDINLNSYRLCVANHQTAEEVDRDLAFAEEHKIQATPTLFVNGVRKDGIMRAAEVRRLANSLAERLVREIDSK